ncbi:MAG TPA: hypothetical protein VGP44_02195, partial [Gemmatimonadales bacterium]|nr:hypothetical protein [Gemmatimonadales bacterium]
MRRSGPIALSLLLALAGAACATKAATTTSSGPRTLQVGMSDSGTKVTMHIGDRLVITLPKVDIPIPGAPSAWYLAPYPADALEVG